MKIKVIRVINAIPILKEMAATKFKVSTTYKIKKIIDECNDVATAFETQRIALLDQYAVLSEDKTEYKFDAEEPTDMEKFNVEMEVVTEDEVEMNVPMISIDEIDSFDIEPARIGIIDWFLEV